MRKVEAAGRSVIRLAYLSAVVAVLGVIVLAGIYEERSQAAFRQGARAEVQNRLGVLRSDLQGTLDANIQVARALAGVVRYQPGIDQAEFSRLGEELVAELPAIRTIAAAPDLVVRMVHPLECSGRSSASTTARCRARSRRWRGRGISARPCWRDRST